MDIKGYCPDHGARRHYGGTIGRHLTCDAAYCQRLLQDRPRETKAIYRWAVISRNVNGVGVVKYHDTSRAAVRHGRRIVGPGHTVSVQRQLQVLRPGQLVGWKNDGPEQTLDGQGA